MKFERKRNKKFKSIPGPCEPAQSGPWKVDEVFAHCPVTFAADVKAQNVVVVPEGLVIFLFGWVEQQVNLGGR